MNKNIQKAIKRTQFTPEELTKWLAIRKKCHIHKSKKDYTRKEKYSNAKYDN